jgi:hypothetical protein
MVDGVGLVGVELWLGRGVGDGLGDADKVEVGVFVSVGEAVRVGMIGVNVGRGVGVTVGVGDWYQREVGVNVRVEGIIGEGVTSTSGGYSSSMADIQSRPSVSAYSLKRAAG